MTSCSITWCLIWRRTLCTSLTQNGPTTGQRYLIYFDFSTSHFQGLWSRVRPSGGKWCSEIIHHWEQGCQYISPTQLWQRDCCAHLGIEQYVIGATINCSLRIHNISPIFPTAVTILPKTVQKFFMQHLQGNADLYSKNNLRVHSFDVWKRFINKSTSNFH